jgi:Rieske Fe-S protein
MADSPDSSPRRRFLAGLVGGTALSAAGAAGAATVYLSTEDATWGGKIGYRGPRSVTGPADRALPQVPVRVDDDGYLHGRFPAAAGDGVPTTTLGGVDYSAEWFRYCGGTTHPGLRADADQDTYLRAAPGSPYEWQAEALAPGERLHVSAFEDYRTWSNGVGTDGVGKPAMATWRSRGTDETIHVQVLRSARVPGGVDGDDDWLAASTDVGFVAWMADCVNRCAVTAFKGYESSETFDAGDVVYCPRHQSLFDPFEVVADSFAAPKWET